MNFKLFIRKNISLARCPNCNDLAALKRSRTRNIFEKALKQINFKFYTCQSCGWRGTKFSYKFSRNFFFLVILYFLIVIVATYLVRLFLESYFK